MDVDCQCPLDWILGGEGQLVCGSWGRGNELGWRGRWRPMISVVAAGPVLWHWMLLGGRPMTCVVAAGCCWEGGL